MRSIKAYKLNLLVCAFETIVESKPKKATCLVAIEHVLDS